MRLGRCSDKPASQAAGLALALAFAAACGGDPSGPSGPPAATRLSLVGAPAAEARSGLPLDVQPIIQLQDASGSAVARSGVTVTATILGGGTLTGNAVATGADGRAVFSALTVRGLRGPRTISFAAAGLTAATHSVSLVAGPAARITPTVATTQVATMGEPVAVNPAVRVSDADLNPVGGIGVTFAAAPGNGTITGTSQTTGADGVATLAAWRLPATAGMYAIAASSPGLEGNPVMFQAQGVPLMPGTIVVHAGADQSATTRTAVAVAPAVRLTQGSTPTPGVAVTFAVSSGGGTITGAEQMTDANGVAAVGSWTLGDVGPNALTATSAGVPGSPVSISATALGVGNLAVDPLPAIAVTGSVHHPRVRVATAAGAPIAGVPVAFAVGAGSGSLGSATATTDVNGYASVSWTLGSGPGMQRLTITAPPEYGNSPRAVEVRTFVKLATATAIHAGNGQSATVGSLLPVNPAIRITAADGTPVPGWPVTFQIGGGSGSITGEATFSDADGVAAVGGWRLNIHPGRNEIFVNAPGGVVTFFAQALIGPAAHIVPESATPLEGVVGQPPYPDPSARITDELGNGIAGHPVTFTVSAGGGSIAGGSQLTDEFGFARPASWTLGTQPGTNRLTVSAQGVAASISITAIAHAGPPVEIIPIAGNAQTAGTGQRVPIDPRVEVRDAFGNPVPGVGVRFTPTAGGGSLTTGTEPVLTGASGRASTGWTLGSAGTNTLRASVADNDALATTFSATAVGPTDPFNIEIRYLAAPTIAVQSAVSNAVNRWTGIVAEGLASQPVSLPAGSCYSAPAIGETIDDLVIFVEVIPIDGVGGNLGGATACAVRSGGLPAVGFMRFDAADLADLSVNGELGDVVLHEIGHVLGFGTLWPSFGLLAFGPEPYFTGGYALQSYRDLGGTAANGPGVPVENTGGQGTANSHWRESVFGNELMTGYILGADNRLTAITISSLRDIGYRVSYVLAAPLGTPLSLRRDGGTAPRKLQEVPLEGPIIVLDGSGRVTTTISPTR